MKAKLGPCELLAPEGAAACGSLRFPPARPILELPRGVQFFDVAPDGSRFLIRKPVADPDPNDGIHVVLDGFAELRQPEAPESR